MEVKITTSERAAAVLGRRGCHVRQISWYPAVEWAVTFPADARVRYEYADPDDRHETTTMVIDHAGRTYAHTGRTTMELGADGQYYTPGWAPR